MMPCFILEVCWTVLLILNGYSPSIKGHQRNHIVLHAVYWKYAQSLTTNVHDGVIELIEVILSKRSLLIVSLYSHANAEYANCFNHAAIYSTEISINKTPQNTKSHHELNNSLSMLDTITLHVITNLMCETRKPL